MTVHLNAEGLYFQSYEVNKDFRTALNLTPQDGFSLTKGFSFDFDLKLRRSIHNFGYIFRMIINDKQNLDLVVRGSSPSRSYFLVVGNENKLTFSEKNNFKDDEKWTHIRIQYSKGKDELHLKIGDTEQKTKLNGTISSFKDVRISFGETNHHSFSTTDVAPMILKDIKLDDANGNIYFWELCKHGKNEVRDINQNYKAIVSHPLWLIDQKAYWKKNETFLSSQRHFWAYNENKSEIYIAGPNHLYTYNLKNNHFNDTVISINNSCFYSDAARLIFDSKTNQLLSYEIDSTDVESFDFKQRRWKNKHFTSSSPIFWHHNHFISSQDSSLCCFGGYGYHQYKSILNKYSFKTKTWRQEDLSSYIAPRYLSALGKSKDKIYIFGGYGSKTGEQQVSPRYFYDLYELNPQNNFIKRIWEYENPGNSFVQGNSMVVNEKEKCFYTLCYSSEKYHSCIYLNRFSLETPTRTTLADSIPFLFNDTESMCDLFLDEKENKLIALTQILNFHNQYEINIYTLTYPPILYSDVFQEQASTFNYTYIIIAIILFIIILVTGYFIIFKRNVSLNKKAIKKIHIIKDLPNIHTIDTDIITPIIKEKRKASIIFLGGFQVIGITGDDITGSFTPTLKNLLVLILLNTITKKKGISSEILIERFWYDKNESSARNNLSVNIKRLRSLLEQIGSIKVIHSNGYWTIELSDSVFYDYKEVRDQLEFIQKTADSQSENEINLVLQQITSGLLLPSIQNEWIDEYKSEYTNIVIETLRQLLEIDKFKSSGEFRLRICNAILLFDTLDEDALIEKCKVLYELGRKGQAKSTYDTYCKNYRTLLNTNFKIPFKEIIKEE